MQFINISPSICIHRVTFTFSMNIMEDINFNIGLTELQSSSSLLDTSFSSTKTCKTALIFSVAFAVACGHQEGK